MSNANFFNENINRSFPFKQGTVGVDTPSSGAVTMSALPDEFIADCGFILGPESGFVAEIHSVYLHKISRPSNDQLDFEFRSDAPALGAAPLIFSRLITDPIFTCQYLDSDSPAQLLNSQSSSLSDSAAGPGGEPFWSGYLVTGNLTKITERLATGQVILRATNTEALVEPALIQILSESQVVSLNLANKDRVRALRPAECPQNVWNFTPGGIYTAQEGLQGDIRLRAGYNVSLGQNVTSNTLQISATLAAGAGQPCSQIPLFNGETPPLAASNNLLGGDYYCNEVLRTVNGLAGPTLQFYAGNGIAITPDPTNHAITIDVNLATLAVCTYSAVSESL